MRELFELAEYLVCGWRLAHGAAPMPTRDGVLDLAIHKHVDLLPGRLSSALSFGVTRVGFRCYELADIVHAAQANLLAEGFDGSDRLTPTIDEHVATMLLRRRSVKIEDAAAFARKLGYAIREFEKTDRLTLRG